jgi:hypothetical protein
MIQLLFPDSRRTPLELWAPAVSACSVLQASRLRSRGSIIRPACGRQTHQPLCFDTVTTMMGPLFVHTNTLGSLHFFGSREPATLVMSAVFAE